MATTTNTTTAITGTNSSDSLIGTSGNDVINSGAGDDTVYGGAGNDTINGGSGNDTLDGGSGSDTVDGGSGNDVLIYTVANTSTDKDVYTGGSGIDTVLINFQDAAQWAQYKQQVQNYQTHLAQYTNPVTGEVSNGAASDFTFNFNGGATLTVQMIEQVRVTVGTASIDLKDNFAAQLTDFHLATTSDSGVSQTDNITKVVKPTFEGGEAEPFATITVYDNNGVSIGTTQAKLDGSWSFPVSDALAEGVHNLTVTQTDLMGNTSAKSSVLAVTIDTHADVPNVALAQDTGASGMDHITSDGTLKLAGVETDAKVEYSIDGGKTWTDRKSVV